MSSQGVEIKSKPGKGMSLWGGQHKHKLGEATSSRGVERGVRNKSNPGEAMSLRGGKQNLGEAMSSQGVENKSKPGEAMSLRGDFKRHDRSCRVTF